MQTTVNVLQGFGVVGSFYDASPRRVNPMVVTAGTPVVAVKASGVVTLTGVPTAADTISIGGYVYTFKETLAAAFDVKIGISADATAKSLTKAINASGTAGVDYFAGTTANLSVTAADTDTAEVTVTAIYEGVVGNAVVFLESADNLTIAPTSGVLAGGVDAYANSATVGRAFSYDSSDKGLAVQGGTGVFAGILVNPKSYTHSGLTSTLVVENGVTAELATMGHIVVKPLNSAVVGYSAYRDNSSGEIYAYSGTGSQSGKTLIAGSMFVLVDSTAPNGLAVLSITNP